MAAVRSPTRRSRDRLLCAALALLCVALSPAGAAAQGQALQAKLSGRALVDALREGGYVMLLRHTATDAFVGDPGTLDLADCATQRNLSEMGRAQAEAMGRAIKTLGIPIGKVISSPYCRCVDTAKLAFGETEVLPELTVGEDLTYEERAARGSKIRVIVGTEPSEGTNTVLVTHTGILLYTFGLQAKPEGIAHVFRPAEFGPAVYIGAILPGEWGPLAAGAPAAP
jgi:phosphohistidine phosphatase SixA